MKQLVCLQCETSFTSKHPNHVFCTEQCCAAYNKSKSWASYFTNLLSKKKDSTLTVADLQELLIKQHGRCALTGVTLTKIAGKGRAKTNASIDRIIPGGDYSPENVRLVCSFVNSFRGTSSDEDFVWWCQRVVQ